MVKITPHQQPAEHRDAENRDRHIARRKVRPRRAFIEPPERPQPQQPISKTTAVATLTTTTAAPAPAPQPEGQRHARRATPPATAATETAAPVLRPALHHLRQRAIRPRRQRVQRIAEANCMRLSLDLARQRNVLRISRPTTRCPPTANIPHAPPIETARSPPPPGWPDRSPASAERRWPAQKTPSASPPLPEALHDLPQRSAAAPPRPLASSSARVRSPCSSTVSASVNSARPARRFAPAQRAFVYPVNPPRSLWSSLGAAIANTPSRSISRTISRVPSVESSSTTISSQSTPSTKPTSDCATSDPGTLPAPPPHCAPEQSPTPQAALRNPLNHPVLPRPFARIAHSFVL